MSIQQWVFMKNVQRWEESTIRKLDRNIRFSYEEGRGSGGSGGGGEEEGRERQDVFQPEPKI